MCNSTKSCITINCGCCNKNEEDLGLGNTTGIVFNELWSGETSTVGDLELTDSIENYKLIVIATDYVTTSGHPEGKKCEVYPTSLIENKSYELLAPVFTFINTTPKYGYIMFTAHENILTIQSVEIGGLSNNPRLLKVYGIK